MEDVIQKFIRYLHKTKKASNNTEVSYERDLKKLQKYIMLVLILFLKITI